MKRIGRWTADWLLYPTAAALVVGAWRLHWGIGLAVFVVSWYFLVTRPMRRLAEALNQAEYREWALGTRFLSILGWANTLGEGGVFGGPHVSRDKKNTCERWWYRPDRVSDGNGGTLPHSDLQAVADFSRMTMTATNEGESFTFDLRWNTEDPFSPFLQTRIASKTLNTGQVDFVEGCEWSAHSPNGADVAYRIYLWARDRWGGNNSSATKQEGSTTNPSHA